MFGKHWIARCRRLLAAAVVVPVAACEMQPIESSSQRYAIDLSPRIAAERAQEHCASYGKRAELERIDQYRFNRSISIFNCLDDSG